MRKLLLLIKLILFSSVVVAQVNALNHLIYGEWPSINSQKISNDGKFVIYTIETENSGPTLIIQSTDGSYKREISKATNSLITDDNRNVIFSMPGDSVCLLELNSGNIKVMTGISSFKVVTGSVGQWMACKLNNAEKQVMLRNMVTGNEIIYPFVEDYFFSENGKVLLLQANTMKDNIVFDKSLIWISLSDTKKDTIMHRIGKIGRFVFDKAGRQLAFVSEVGNGEDKTKAIMYYTVGMDSAIVRVGKKTPGIEVDLDLCIWDGIFKFSKDGRKLFFPLMRIPNMVINSKLNNHGVNIWSYNHPLQSQQLKGKIPNYLNPIYTAVINENDNNAICLNCLNNDDWKVELSEEGNGEFVLVSTKSNFWEKDWKLSERPSIYLISTKNGLRRLIKERLLATATEPVFSSNGRYVIWYDRLQKNYFAYNVVTNVCKNITKPIPVRIYNDENDRPNEPFSFGIGGWLENDIAILIYDRYDIWQVDPEGFKSPVNVTNGYGRKNQIVLRYIQTIKNTAFNTPVIKPGETLLLAAFNRSNKYNGFFQKQLGLHGNPVQLTMGPYIYYYPLQSSDIHSFLPIKAQNANMFIVQRMSATEYPNIFITNDFRNMVQLSTLQPQKNFRWMTTELIRWKMFNGMQGEGILYKPENFDHNKKYPIVFYFYEKDADGLYNFINPIRSNGTMNIAYFVSNGYLVFDPNIYYNIGYPGESAYNSVVSAAKYLSKLPWVDSGKMGLQGISWGGYEVNYLITRTNIFAAAASSAGLSNFISAYGSLSDNGHSLQTQFETGQGRIGANLWQKPELYIKNSPIFKADKVQTPLLIMHNKEDGAAPWSQAIEWFTALRRLNKKVWMLQYDGEGHGISQPKNQLDYSIRLGQFFDHYLKSGSEPRWLTEGVPASLKGIDLGLELSNK